MEKPCVIPTNARLFLRAVPRPASVLVDGVFLIGVESLMLGVDPAEYGFDAMLEFAPDWSCTTLLSEPDARPRVFDYAATVANMVAKKVPSYAKLRCVFPGWDNTPRCEDRGIVFGNASQGQSISPAIYNLTVEMLSIVAHPADFVRKAQRPAND